MKPTAGNRSSEPGARRAAPAALLLLLLAAGAAPWLPPSRCLPYAAGALPGHAAGRLRAAALPGDDPPGAVPPAPPAEDREADPR